MAMALIIVPWGYTGTTTAINSALNGLTYEPPADFDGVATISFLTDDFGNVGSGGSKTAEKLTGGFHSGGQ